MGQWLRNLTNKQRRNSRKPRAGHLELMSVEELRANGVEPIIITASLDDLGMPGMSVALMESAKANAAAGIKTEYISTEAAPVAQPGSYYNPLGVIKIDVETA